MPISRRRLLALPLAAALLGAVPALAAEPVTDLRIDWAFYNPVSLVLKDQGLLEKEFAKDGITITWVQSAGSNKALEFLNAGSLDFGSTAGAAALIARINGNPVRSVYVYSRPEWTALVTTKDSKIAKVADLARATPEVVECHRITGEDCFFMKAHVRDVEHLEEVIDRFTPFGQTTTSVMQTSPVPLRGVAAG